MTRLGPPDETGAALREMLARLGPFFAVDSHPVGATRPSTWRSLAELLERPVVLADWIGAVRHALAADRGMPVAEIELGVAASTAQFGLVARLVAPALAAAAVGGRLLDGEPGELWWRPELGGPLPLSLPLADGLLPPGAVNVATVAGRLADHLAAGPVGQLTAVMVASVPVSARVLWGNIGSAVNTAATLIAASRPADAPSARAIAGAVLADVRFGDGPTAVGAGFRRTSCCLIYRAAPGRDGPLCGDCVIIRPDTSKGARP